MSAVQVLLAALAGVVAAIPGMSALQKAQLPGQVGPFFDFTLAAFSSAGVLASLQFRDVVQRLRRRTITLIFTAGMTVILGLVVVNTWVLNLVYIEHQWSKPAVTFVPLFLPADGRRLVDSAGSRYKLIMSQGPDVVPDKLITERNVAETAVVMLISYTALVTLLSTLFIVLGMWAVQREGAGQPAGAGAKPS
jgi:hypothetical protein